METVTLDTFLNSVLEISKDRFSELDRVILIATERAKEALKCYNFAVEVVSHINSKLLKVTYILAGYYGDDHYIFIETPEGLKYSVTTSFKNPPNFTICPVVSHSDKGFMAIKDSISSEINGRNAKRMATRLENSLETDVLIFKKIKERKEALEQKKEIEQELLTKMNKLSNSHAYFPVSTFSDFFKVQDAAISLTIYKLTVDECVAIQNLIKNMRSA